MSTVDFFVVVGADRSVRTAKRPQIKDSEVAFRFRVVFPQSWGRVDTGQPIVLNMPEIVDNVHHAKT